MAITVSCPACGSRFSLSDDLYRRRVAGSLVKVKCRTCSAEIAVDATETSAATSIEASNPYPGPPRPKAITQMGLGTPPPPAGLATTSPLPGDDFARPPLPLNATITPLPVTATSGAAPVSVDPDSMWADEETIAINVKAKPLPKPPSAPVARVDAETEALERIDAEEIPVSSSGAPTLDALTMEAGGAHVPHGRPPADEFLVSFHGGSDNSVGAPTIDVSGIGDDAETPLNASTVDVTSFASEISPSGVDFALDDRELEYRPARGTVQQFDMNAGTLPATSTKSPAAESVESAVSTPLRPRKPAAEPSLSADRPRERKFVIPPQEAPIAIAVPRKPRRSRAPLWAGLLIAAGAVGAGFGYRERVRSASLAESPRPVPSPVVNTQAALPAEAITEANEAASAAPAESAVTPDAPVAPVAQTVAAATTRDVAPTTVAAVKSTTIANTTTRSPSTAAAVPAVEKPVTADKPLETHNAPPPAAPDTAFDRDAARNALASAEAQASACRKEGDPSGTASLTITFAPSGRVTSAQIQGPPFSGTATGGCIASTMRRASVPAFSGDYVTVSKTIVVQ